MGSSRVWLREVGRHGMRVMLAGSLLVSPLVFFANWSSLTAGQLRVGALACVFGAIATFCFNRMLATTPATQVANMFLLMLVCQVAVPAALLLRQGASMRQIAELGVCASRRKDERCSNDSAQR